MKTEIYNAIYNLDETIDYINEQPPRAIDLDKILTALKSIKEILKSIEE